MAKLRILVVMSVLAIAVLGDPITRRQSFRGDCICSDFTFFNPEGLMVSFLLDLYRKIQCKIISIRLATATLESDLAGRHFAMFTSRVGPPASVSRSPRDSEPSAGKIFIQRFFCEIDQDICNA